MLEMFDPKGSCPLPGPLRPLQNRRPLMATWQQTGLRHVHTQPATALDSQALGESHGFSVGAFVSLVHVVPFKHIKLPKPVCYPNRCVNRALAVLAVSCDIHTETKHPCFYAVDAEERIDGRVVLPEGFLLRGLGFPHSGLCSTWKSYLQI